MSDLSAEKVVAELRALASKATTGNWYIYTGEDGEPISLAADGVGPNGGWVGKTVAKFGVPYRARTAEQIAADAAYLKAVQPSAVMALLDLIAHQAARLEEMRDFGGSSCEAAGRILEYLGIGQDAGREPGADRRRDHIAALIEREIKAALTAAEAEKERLARERDEAKEALRQFRERHGYDDDPLDVRELAWKMWRDDQPGIIWSADNKRAYRAKARAALSEKETGA